MANKLSRRVIARTVAAKLLAEPARQKHWLKATAAYLIENNLADDAELLLNDIAHELYAQSGQLFADVTSARPLTDSVRSDLKKLLAEMTGAKHIALSEHTDPELLGGLIVRTPSAQLDASVRTTLKQLASLS